MGSGAKGKRRHSKREGKSIPYRLSGIFIAREGFSEDLITRYWIRNRDKAYIESSWIIINGSLLGERNFKAPDASFLSGQTHTDCHTITVGHCCGFRERL